MGFVDVEIQGLNLEKFLNLLIKNNIEVCCVRRKEFNKFCVKVPYSNYKKFLEVSNKLCYNIIVNKYTGLIKILKFFKERLALVLSLVCATVLIFISNMFVFQFEINGNSNVTTEQICEVLSNNNVSFGTLKSNIGLKEIQNLLLENFEEMSLVSCTIVGNTLFINIKESILVDKVVEEFIYE